jgi:DNA-binding transcriptional LysR family regulator
MEATMTLEQLRVFVAVAERQHVTKAAQALNLAQSAVSNAIAVLEARHDTKLFDRVGRTIELTEAGKVFLEEARAVLARAKAAEAALMEFGTLKRGTLSVQASQTIASYWLPRHLVAFRQTCPHVEIHFRIGNTAQVVSAIENREVELGFVEGAAQSPVLTSTPVAQDQLVVVVAEEHPLTDLKAPTVDELLDIEWVLREPGSGTRSVFEDALAQRGIDPARLRIALELPSNEAVRAAVEAGMGATAISASVAAPSIEAGLLHQVAFALPVREFHVLTHSERNRSRAAAALLDLVATTRANRVSAG